MRRKSQIAAPFAQIVHGRNVAYRPKMDDEDSHTESEGIIELGQSAKRRFKERQREKGGAKFCRNYFRSQQENSIFSAAHLKRWFCVLYTVFERLLVSAATETYLFKDRTDDVRRSGMTGRQQHAIALRTEVR